MSSAADTGAQEGRRERSKRKKLERIRTTARRLFAERGFVETTTRQIAAEADIGTGTLFLYAPSKEDLLVLIFQDEVERAVDEAFEATPEGPLLDQVLAVFDAITRHHAADPALARVFVKELPFVDSGSEGVRHFLSHLYGLLAVWIEAAKTRGEIAADIPGRLLAQNLFATYFQHLQGWLSGRMTALEPGDERLRAALELQLRGARAQGATR
jgi:AcrR family transcriptional regulator